MIVRWTKPTADCLAGKLKKSQNYLCRPKKKVLFFRHFPQGSKSSRLLQGRQQGVTKISYIMPKVKTNSSAKKRFKVTGTGKITFKSLQTSHLTKKSTKRKRAMRKDGVVADANMHFVKRLLRFEISVIPSFSTNQNY
jgi:large subunit ribosomal protein L35